MEYLEGETLKQVLGRGPVALDDVLDWGCQVARRWPSPTAMA
jgi:hypothetical protein